MPYDSPETQVPPLTNTDYERNNSNARANQDARRRKTPATSATNKSAAAHNKRKKTAGRRLSICSTGTMHLSPRHFGESGRCAELSASSQHSLSDEDVEHVATTREILALLLQQLNCIGAALTLGPEDTLRVFSYDFAPTRVFADDGPLCDTCCKDPSSSACTECEEASALLNKVDKVTRRIFDVVVRPSFSPPFTGPHGPRTRLLKEIRYHQDIFRPAPPPTTDK